MAEYQGKKVTLNKPFYTPGEAKKRAVYVRNPKGTVINCDTATDKTTPRYHSCKAW